MKKKLLLVVLLAAAAPVLWLGSGGSPNWADQNQAMGHKLAGGWLTTIEIPSMGITGEVLLNLNADGCMVMSGQLLNPFFGGLGMNTTAHGSWKWTGPNQIEACLLLFEQNDNGATYVYEKGRLSLTLKEGGTLLEGPLEINLIRIKDVTPKPDPLAPVASGNWIPATITARPIWFPADL
jgi:hypothetical protein